MTEASGVLSCPVCSGRLSDGGSGCGGVSAAEAFLQSRRSAAAAPAEPERSLSGRGEHGAAGLHRGDPQAGLHPYGRAAHGWAGGRGGAAAQPNSISEGEGGADGEADGQAHR